MTDPVNVPREVLERIEAHCKRLETDGSHTVIHGTPSAPTGNRYYNYDLARDLRSMLAAAPKAEPVEFGKGMVVVDTGTYRGEPAVFIAPARIGGAVGESSAIEGHARDVLQDGETVLTFPTEEQAQFVADALVNAQPEAPKVEQEPFGYWVKHRFADSPVFLIKGSFLPRGYDYSITPLYTQSEQHKGPQS